jgi:hypothetical protein
MDELLFLAADPSRDLDLTVEVGWKPLARGGFEAWVVPGDHGSVLRAEAGEPLARALADCLGHAYSATSSGRSRVCRLAIAPRIAKLLRARRRYGARTPT